MKKILFLSIVILASSFLNARLDKAFLERVDFLRGERGIIVPAKQAAKRGGKKWGSSGGVIGALFGALIGHMRYTNLIKEKSLLPEEYRPLKEAKIDWKWGKDTPPHPVVLGAIPLAFWSAIGAAAGASFGGVVGFVVGSISGPTERAFLRSRMNATLGKYALKDFEDHGQSQAALIYASYMRDSEKMYTALNLPENQEFLRQPGVREVICRFYYGNAGPESLNKLAAMNEGTA